MNYYNGKNIGDIYLAYDAPQPNEKNNKDLYLEIEDDGFTILSPEAGMELLIHLNELLGRPMSYAPVAAG